MGADFVVWAKEMPTKAETPKTAAADLNQAKVKPAKAKRLKVAKTNKKAKAGKPKPVQSKQAASARVTQAKVRPTPVTRELSIGPRSQRYSRRRIEQFERSKPAKRRTLR
jgi:hypothetical protein